MSLAISIQGISKAYQIGTFNSGSFSRDISRWWAIKRGKEDPFLKIIEENDRTITSQSNIIWSLKDITFDIQQGDSVGLIGRNGAGKSTLLKVLSQITQPTTGSFKMRGKVASLLEVGTGFHPELTGRENIFLNGAILGMNRNEITRKFDEIVAFSGVEKYIDTPVKRYSSGMFVRLAFAVAAHLDSDILIVDEVLAVGDADFQKKCVGKMNDLGGNSGRTIIFVSHNMSSVKAICEKSIFLEKGKIEYSGETGDVINRYMKAYAPASTEDGYFQQGKSLHGNGSARFTRFMPFKEGKGCSDFFFGEHPKFKIELEIFDGISDAVLSIYIISIYGEVIAMGTPGNYKGLSLDKGKIQMEVALEEVLMPGEYTFNLGVAKRSNGESIDYVESVGSIRVLKESMDDKIDYPWNVIHGYYMPNTNWTIKQN